MKEENKKGEAKGGGENRRRQLVNRGPEDHPDSTNTCKKLLEASEPEEAAHGS